VSCLLESVHELVNKLRQLELVHINWTTHFGHISDSGILILSRMFVESGKVLTHKDI